MDETLFDELLASMRRPGDELAAMRAHPDMTLDQAITMHRRVFGFSDTINEVHELAHVLLGLTGFKRYQADYEGESFTLAIEDVLSTAMDGKDIWNKEELGDRARSYNASFAGDENMMRTLLYLLSRSTGRDQHAVGASVGFENDAVIEMASGEDIVVKQITAVDTNSAAWTIETGTAGYLFDASPANPACHLPAAVVPMQKVGDDDVDHIFDTLDDAMSMLVEKLIDMRSNTTKGAINAMLTDNAASKAVLMAMPVSTVLEVIDGKPPRPAKVPKGQAAAAAPAAGKQPS